MLFSMTIFAGIATIFYKTTAIIAVLQLYFINCGDAAKCAYFVRFFTHFMADTNTLHCFHRKKSTSAKERSTMVAKVVPLYCGSKGPPLLFIISSLPAQ